MVGVAAVSARAYISEPLGLVLFWQEFLWTKTGCSDSYTVWSGARWLASGRIIAHTSTWLVLTRLLNQVHYILSFLVLYFSARHPRYWHWLLRIWLDIWATGGGGRIRTTAAHSQEQHSARVTVPGESTPVFLSNPSSPNDARDLLRNHEKSASEAAVETPASNWWPAKMRFGGSPELLTFGLRQTSDWLILLLTCRYLWPCRAYM